MTASNAECKKGLPMVSQPGLDVFLDRNDLDQLDFLQRVGKHGNLADPGQTVCLPRHQMTEDLFRVLSSLESAGRVSVKQRLARNSLTPRQSGQMVIRPGVGDATVLEAFRDVRLPVLEPLLEFDRAHPNLLQSATLLPNVSRGLKGIVLQFDPRRMDWIGAIAGMNWPISRGLITVALPPEMDAERFIDESDNLLPKVSAIGRSSSGGVKHIRFYYAPKVKNRVFMAISAGLTDSQRRGVSHELGSTHKPGRVLGLIREVEETCYERRQNLAASISVALGLGSVEEVLNVPYVMLYTETGQAVSGGVGPGSDLLPFTLGGGIIIHNDPSSKIVPFGLKRKEAESPLPGFISPDKVNSFVNTLQHPLRLEDLVLGYHPKMD